ncbi:MAG: hypothetical protein OEY29_15610 [Gammaproteobacteria bacterium]|nr:hypothetical protein [Gammaproteobacteria bacterium]
MQMFAYRLFWRLRFLISILAVSVLIVLGVLYFQGFDGLKNEPESLIFIISLYSILNIYNLRRERKLVKSVRVNGKNLTIQRGNNTQIEFNVSEIISIESGRKTQKLNQFGIPETVIKTNTDEIIMTENIKEFKKLMTLLKRP